MDFPRRAERSREGWSSQRCLGRRWCKQKCYIDEVHIHTAVFIYIIPYVMYGRRFIIYIIYHRILYIVHYMSTSYSISYVWYIMNHITYIGYHISNFRYCIIHSILYHLSCMIYYISYITYHVSYIIIWYIISHVSCIMGYLLYILYNISCITSSHHIYI